MSQIKTLIDKTANRRSFLKNGIAAGAATMGAGLVGGGYPPLARMRKEIAI
jgi:hypothetical protein